MGKLTFNEKLAIIKKTDVFEQFPDMVLKSIIDVLEEVSVNEGNTFINKGEEGTCMYVLCSGKLRVHDEDAKIAEVEPISVIGEMAILTTEPRLASVTAIQDSKLLKINQTEFEVLAEDNVEFYKSIVKMLISKLQKQNLELAEFARNARRIASLF